MAYSWDELSVAELQARGILLVEDGNHGNDRPLTHEFCNEGTAFIRAADIKDGVIQFETAEKINEIATSRVRKGKGKPGDVIISHKGTLGKVGAAGPGCPDFVCSPQTTFWRSLDNSQLDSKYLFCYLRSEDFQRRFRVFGGETDMAPYVSLTSQRALQIPLPPIEVQKYIADVIGALDDRLELNRKATETLEAIAKALFKSWFVDFDPVRARAEGRPTGLPDDISDLFPDAFEESELGDIPNGWTPTPLETLLEVERGISYKGEFLSDSDGLPMINLGCFAGEGGFKQEKIKFYKGDYRERHVVNEGDLLIANTDMTQNRIILGSPIVVERWNGHSRFLFSHHVYSLGIKNAFPSLIRYLFFSLLRSEFRQIAAGHATGTTVLALPKDGVLAYSVALPSRPLLDAFGEQASAIYGRIANLREQAATLADLRDTLLPMLISGELRVPDAERFLAEAGV